MSHCSQDMDADVYNDEPLPKQVQTAMATALNQVSKQFDIKRRDDEKPIALLCIQRLFYNKVFLAYIAEYVPLQTFLPFVAMRKAASKASQQELDQALYAVILHWVASKEHKSDASKDEVDFYNMEYAAEILLDEFLADANCFKGQLLWTIIQYRNHRHRARLFELLIRHGAQDNADMHATLAQNNEIGLQNVLRRYGHL